MINSYGARIGMRTYDSGELNPYRRQPSGIEARNGRWEIRYNPYDISRVWVRNHHESGWLTATWTHLRTVPVPFGEQAWNHARQLLAARGSPVCRRHRLWTGPAARTHDAQLEISPFPEILLTQRRHLALVNQHHWQHVDSAFSHATAAIHDALRAGTWIPGQQRRLRRLAPSTWPPR